jgi:PAS domain S-box-containing protein
LLDEYPSIRSALKGEEVTGVEKAGADKTSQLYAMVPIRSLGWVAGASIPEKEVLAPIAKGLLRDLGIFLAVAAGSLLVAFAVSRRISAPIEELRKSVSSMGAGTWGRKVDVRGPREIKDLAKTFNRMAEEIGEREARLGESERRYRTLFESMTEAFALAEIILDEDGKPCDYRLLEVNPAYERLTGISREAVLGKTARELFPDIGRERIERLGYVARTGHPTAFQECVQRLGKWFELYVFSPGRGKFGYLFLDITERKRADEALRRSELKYRIVAEHPYNCEFWLSPEGKFIYLSPSCKRITGYEAEEFMRDRGLSRSIIHPDDLAAFDRHRQEEEEGEEEVLGQEIQFRIVNADGTIRWIGHTCMRISDEEGRYLGIRGTNRDITIRKQAEDALRKSEEKYRDLVENLYDQVSELDINGHLLYLSPNFKQITGYDVEDYIGRDFLESVHPDDAPLLGMEIRKGFEQGYGHMVFRFRHKNGNWLWIESMGKTFQTSAGSLRGVVISRDITEHRNMEKELRRSHDELEMRVQERTAELETEIEQRKRTAEALRESEKELRYLSSQLLIAQEKERREVAGELHDNIWQILNTIRWEIEMIFFRHGKRGPSADPGRSQRIISDIRNAVERIRTMQGDLWPPLLDDIGIVATINWYCRDFEKNHPSIRIEKHIDLSEEDVPAPIRIVIYRVMKEALENVLRHSQASSTALSLRNTDHRIEFTLRDNGIGFDLERVFKRSMPWAGLGLMSMRERTEHTGGSFEIESGDGSGTTVRASWPVEA